MLTLSKPNLAGLLCVMIACFIMPLAVPFNVGIMIDTFGASPSQAGLVATVDSLFAAFVALSVSRYLHLYSIRTFFRLGLVVIATGHAASAFSPDIYWLMGIQAYAGIGVGMVIAVVMATAGLTTKPEMTLGLINSSLGAFLIVLGFSMPAIITQSGFFGAYMTYAIVAVIGLLATIWVPDFQAPKPKVESVEADMTQSDTPPDGSKKVVLFALIGIGIFFAAQSGLGSFVERIGQASGLSLQLFGLVFAVGGLLTIIGPLIAGWVGPRFGTIGPLVVLVTGMCCACFGLAVLTSQESFFISAPMFTLMPALLTPIFLGALAFVDQTGRAMAMQSAFSILGGAMGPFFAGVIAESQGYSGLGWYAITLFIVAASLMSVTAITADRIRKQLKAMNEQKA